MEASVPLLPASRLLYIVVGGSPQPLHTIKVSNPYIVIVFISSKHDYIRTLKKPWNQLPPPTS
jgi:hypothetical protein